MAEKTVKDAVRESLMLFGLGSLEIDFIIQEMENGKGLATKKMLVDNRPLSQHQSTAIWAIKLAARHHAITWLAAIQPDHPALSSLRKKQ